MSCPLVRFAAAVPLRPYWTQNPSGGIFIGDAKHALTKRFIQFNPPHLIQYLAFDIDSEGQFGEGGAMSWLDRGLPPPNIVVKNRKNGHVHYLYELAAPVFRGRRAKAHPLRYLSAIEAAFREVLEADPGYRGLLVKNPIHEDWITYVFRKEPYSLLELSDYVDLSKHIRSRFVAGLGRNCTLFEELRRWAYERIEKHRDKPAREAGITIRKSDRIAWKVAAFEPWKAAVWKHAEALNVFAAPLSRPEVHAIAKSVAKWTWENYDGRVSDDEFSLRQAARGRTSRILAGARNQEKVREFLVQWKLTNGKLPRPKEVATALRLCEKTIRSHMKAIAMKDAKK